MDKLQLAIDALQVIAKSLTGRDSHEIATRALKAIQVTKGESVSNTHTNATATPLNTNYVSEASKTCEHKWVEGPRVCFHCVAYEPGVQPHIRSYDEPREPICTTQTARSVPYDEGLRERLKNPEYAWEYVQALWREFGVTAPTAEQKTGGGYPLSDEAQKFIAKVYRCEPPCDSWGACTGCCDKTNFLGGYNIGYRAAQAPTAPEDQQPGCPDCAPCTPEALARAVSPADSDLRAKLSRLEFTLSAFARWDFPDPSRLAWPASEYARAARKAFADAGYPAPTRPACKHEAVNDPTDDAMDWCHDCGGKKNG